MSSCRGILPPTREARTGVKETESGMARPPDEVSEGMKTLHLGAEHQGTWGIFVRLLSRWSLLLDATKAVLLRTSRVVG